MKKQHTYMATYIVRRHGAQIPRGRLLEAESAKQAKQILLDDYYLNSSPYPFYLKVERLPEPQGAQNALDRFFLTRDRKPDVYCSGRKDLDEHNNRNIGTYSICRADDSGVNCWKVQRHNLEGRLVDSTGYKDIATAYANVRFALEWKHQRDGFTAGY